MLLFFLSRQHVNTYPGIQCMFKNESNAVSAFISSNIDSDSSSHTPSEIPYSDESVEIRLRKITGEPALKATASTLQPSGSVWIQDLLGLFLYSRARPFCLCENSIPSAHFQLNKWRTSWGWC